MPLSPADIDTLSRLLDEALELEPAQREAWIDALPPAERALTEPLRVMLAREGTSTRGERFAQLPRMAHDDSVANAGETVGPYRLLREIGRGGMGSVWLAQRADGAYQRQVALKLPRLAWGNGLAERMAREREISALLEHPAIARLYDAGVDERGRPYLAFEYIDGQPIDAWCEAQALGARERLALFLQVVRAVAYAHGRLVVHRDLKPSNVLVTADGHAHLLDFGIAKLLQEAAQGQAELTQELGRILTPQYASPEQVAGEPITVASDVYSLGVLLYELLTGSLPLAPRRTTLGAMEDAILEGSTVLASARARDKALARALRGDLDAILAKAMQRDAQRRYVTAEALAQDIERHLAGETVSAQRASTGYRLRKALRRHWLGASATGAILVAVIGGGTVALVQSHKAERSAERERVVREFVADVFRFNGRLDGADAGRQPTSALALIQGGAGLIEQRFRGQVDMQAELFGVVGSVFSDMGAYQLASDYSARKVEALAALHASRREQASALLALADAQLNDRQYAAAEQRLHRAITLASDEPAIRLDALALLARTQSMQDHLKEAEATAQELEAQAHGGVASPVVQAWTLFIRAAILDGRNHFDQSLPLYRQAIDQALAAQGALSEAAISMRIELADSLAKQFEFKQARETFAAADQALRTLGGAHVIRADYRSAMFAYFLWGYSAMSATAATEQMLASRARLVASAAPLPDWVIPKIDMRVAAIKMEGGKVTAGLHEYEASYGQFLEAIGKDDNPRESILVLASGQLAVGRHEEADRNYREVLRLTNEAGLGSHPYTAWYYKIISLNLRYWGKLDESARFLEAAPRFEPLRTDGGSKDDRAKFIDWERAALQLDLGRPDAATRILEAHRPESADQDAISGYNGTLGEALCRLHQASRGLPLLKKVQKAYDENGSYAYSPDYGNLWAIMGLCLLDAGDRAGARAYAAKARTAFTMQPGVTPYLKAPWHELERKLGVPPSSGVR
jgi:tetratricopeptide (TPR) repeat protein